MKDIKSQGDRKDRDEEAMARLIRLAGPSAPVPEDIEARVYERVHQEWRTSTQAPEDSRVYSIVQREWQRDRRSRALRRWAVPVALAASVLLAVTVMLQPAPTPSLSVPPVASVAKTLGDQPVSGLRAGDSIDSGDIVETGPGQGLSVMMSNADSLRVDENTRLRFDSDNELTLLQGRIYADTGSGVYRDRSLVVVTDAGTVTDVGTQFVVDLGDRAIEVGVREGRVDVTDEDAVFIAVAGERMTLRNGEVASVEPVAAHDAYWAWTADLAPTFEIESRSLLEFLRWASRETGRELVFENNELRMAAMRVDLHGSIDDFTPLQAIEFVMAGTRFNYRIEQDRILIEQ